MKRLVSLGLCFTLSLVLVFGSVLSPSDMNMALAVDMPDAPMTEDTITAGSDGDDEDQGDNNDDQEDDPVTQDTITAGGGSEDDNDEDNSGQSGDNNDNNDNRNEPTTTDSKVTNCPAGQEYGLFTACMPIQDCEIITYPGVVPSNENQCDITLNQECSKRQPGDTRPDTDNTRCSNAP